jgi:group I intron endonuclease
VIQISYANFFCETPAFFVNNTFLQKTHKNIKHSSGIYKITNTITGDCYIGQAKDVGARIQTHKNLLKSNKHVYKNGDLTILQKAWNKYGEDNFKFEILEFCTAEELNDKETYWIAAYKCNRRKYGSGYNLNDGGAGQHVGSMSNKGKIMVNNGEKQIFIDPLELESFEQKGYVKGMLPINIDKINNGRVILYGKDNPNYGRKWSKETRQKIEQYYQERVNFISPLLGGHLSEEHKKLIKDKLKNKPINKNSLEALKQNNKKQQRPVIQLTLDGVQVAEFESIKEAGIQNNISAGNIGLCCRGKRLSAGGYLWRYKYE